jgi:ABC-2 type transport system permease protein
MSNVGTGFSSTPPTGGAGALPPTYVFEDLRGVLLDHVLRADLMLTGLAINSLLFAAPAVGFARLLASARRAGTLLQMGE